jgi:hypothetical protein
LNCIYLNNGECFASPFAEASPVREQMGYKIERYKPTDDEKKKYCTDERNFRACPRFKAYQDDLKFRGLKK